MAYSKRIGTRLVYGIGINDADYVIAHRIAGKQVFCPIYTLWRSMLHRCYGSKRLKYNKAYIGCTTITEWHYFMKFREWVLQQANWDRCGYELDKDLIVKGNRLYSPETCVFVPKVVNNFFTQGEDDDKGIRHFPNRKKPWRAKCGSGSRGTSWSQYYSTKNEARLGYLNKKWEWGMDIAKTLTDEKVKIAFLNRLHYFKDKITQLTSDKV